MRLLTLIIITLSLTGCLALEGPEADGTQPTAVAAKKLAKADPAVGDAKHGEQTFTDNCARCHRTGAGGAPELNGVTARLTRAKFESVLDEGPKVMPSWKHLPASTRDGLWAFLGAATPDKLA